ncbi:MAG TPA: hypothetical protein VGK06_04460 [Methanosarcina sp.]|jgi:hypothetical protein
MIAKTKCPKCNEVHDIEIEIDLNNIPANMGEPAEWSQGIFKCVVFPDVNKSNEETQEIPTIQDARKAMKELERGFLNKITEFEGKYGITIQYIETNLSGIPAWERDNEMRTNSVLVYGDIND